MWTQDNHLNFGRQILAARGIARLSRVNLSKLAKLAHTTVAQAEAGDSAADNAALQKLQGTLESLGFEFPMGTRSATITFHANAEQLDSFSVRDLSMPLGIRLEYRRAPGVIDLVEELRQAGVRVYGQHELEELCMTCEEPWTVTFAKQGRSGRKRGIQFLWTDDARSEDARHRSVSRVLERYSFNSSQVDEFVLAIFPHDEPTSRSPHAVEN
ncbi:hypothetical protein [Achromobacter xylosoxidans]|uniref:hypothetical protein n=1 Tax=Alcaligenes xylosoxydans xylosoxydans TaxID=85698 RepID=UPI0013AF5DE0|nr:hypothetical protein [Achromobacter xylosoxidans]